MTEHEEIRRISGNYRASLETVFKNHHEDSDKSVESYIVHEAMRNFAALVGFYLEEDVLDTILDLVRREITNAFKVMKIHEAKQLEAKEKSYATNS